MEWGGQDETKLIIFKYYFSSPVDSVIKVQATLPTKTNKITGEVLNQLFREPQLHLETTRNGLKHFNSLCRLLYTQAAALNGYQHYAETLHKSALPCECVCAQTEETENSFLSKFVSKYTPNTVHKWWWMISVGINEWFGVKNNLAYQPEGDTSHSMRVLSKWKDPNTVKNSEQTEKIGLEIDAWWKLMNHSGRDSTVVIRSARRYLLHSKICKIDMPTKHSHWAGQAQRIRCNLDGWDTFLRLSSSWQP